MSVPSCSICVGAFDDAARAPKLLACGHTFCAACLAQHHAAATRPAPPDAAKDKKANSKPAELDPLALICPACRHQTTLKSAGDVWSLTTNYALLQLLPGRPAASSSCMVCAKTAKMRCNACGAVLCGAHSDEHEERNAGHECDKWTPAAPPAAASVPAAAASACSPPSPAAPPARSVCKTHQRAMELYCADGACESLICDWCAIEAHKPHNVQPLQRVSKERVAAAQALAAEARKQEAAFAQCVAELAAAEAKLTEEHAAAEAEIRAECAKMRKFVDEREAALLAEAGALAKAEHGRLGASKARAAALQRALAAAAAVGELATDAYGAVAAASGLRADVAAAKEEAELLAKGKAGGAELSVHGAARAAAKCGRAVALLRVGSGVAPALEASVPVANPVHGAVMTFRLGPGYSLSDDCRRAVKGESERWGATVLSTERIAANSGLYEFHLRVQSAQDIMVGFAPCTIDQTVTCNYATWGWYVHLSIMGLWSRAGSSTSTAYGEAERKRLLDPSFYMPITSVWLSVDTTERRISYALEVGAWRELYTDIGIVNEFTGDIEVTGDLVLAALLCDAGDKVELLD